MDEFADLYVWGQRVHGINPADLDRMEIWQIAALFGFHHPNANPAASGRDPLAERLAAAKAGEGSASDMAALAALGTAADVVEAGSLHVMAQHVNG